MIELAHNKITLALHELAPAQAGSTSPPLLTLHGLGERALEPPTPWVNWSGGIWGLDFTGHGASTVPAGGGYTCELLMSDVDIALGHLGPCTIFGRGLGAYIGLMVAGARPDLVRGVVLADGPGIRGGGSEPTSATWVDPPESNGTAPDKMALVELSSDLRPPDYATSFVHLLMALSEMDTPLVVTAKNRPAWLAAVANEPGVVQESSADAYQRYSQA